MARTLLMFLFFVATLCTTLHAAPPKPRVVVLTDVSTWETDDSESLVRLFVHADMLEIEGIVFTTGWSMDTLREDFLGLIHKAIDAYDKDLPNLMKRSQQETLLPNDQRQQVGYWPTADYLREVTVIGSRNRGVKFIGEGNDSAGSELIIRLADEKDDRPLWITLWGGGNTLAQALWRVKKDRSEAELKAFLGKLRVYAITDQDREQRTPFCDSSHLWMRQQFGRDLFFLWDECAWKFQNGTGRDKWADYESHIQNHGHLGTVYPKFKYGVEGDTPSFLHMLPIGLNDPEVPEHGGRGGVFQWCMSEDAKTECYSNSDETSRQVNSSLLKHLYQAQFNDFAARMDWAKAGKGNRNPSVVIDGDSTLDILTREPQAGSSVTFDALGTTDWESDQLTFHWWIARDAGTTAEKATLTSDRSAKATLFVPSDSAGATIHVVCEVTDNGSPPLTGYRRIIVKPR